MPNKSRRYKIALLVYSTPITKTQIDKMRRKVILKTYESVDIKAFLKLAGEVVLVT